MKKNLTFALGLGVFALVSCGGAPSPASSFAPTPGSEPLLDSSLPASSSAKEDDPNEVYFSAYKEAAKRTVAHDNVGMDCKDGILSFSFLSKEYSNIVQAGVKTFEVNPLNFSLRYGNIHTTDAKQFGFSFEMEDDRGANSKIKFDGFGTLFALLGSSVKFAPNFYLENGAAYLDLSDAAFARLLLNRLGSELLDDPFWRLPQKSFSPISQKALDFISDLLPVDSFLEEGVASASDALLEAYRLDKESFAFSSTGQSYEITYNPTSWEKAKEILDQEVFDRVELSEESTISSYFDEASAAVRIEKAETKYRFSGEALLSQSYDFKISFDQEKVKELLGDSSFLPSGDFVFQATISYVLDEEPVRLSSTKKASFEQFDWAKLEELIDKVREKRSSGEENSQEPTSEPDASDPA